MEPQQPPQPPVPAPLQPPAPAPMPAPPPAGAPAQGSWQGTASAWQDNASAWQAPVDPGGPAPGVRFANHGGRLIAYIVDGFILGILTVAVSIVLFTIIGIAAANDSGGAVAGGLFVWFIAVLAISLAYFPWFWHRGGQTPGMKIFHLRVVRDADGGPVSAGSAVLRLFGYWVSYAVFYLGFIWILVDKRRRGWHDLIAGTCVIELP